MQVSKLSRGEFLLNYSKAVETLIFSPKFEIILLISDESMSQGIDEEVRVISAFFLVFEVLKFTHRAVAVPFHGKTINTLIHF